MYYESIEDLLRKLNRSRNLELKNETLQIPTSFFISQIQYLSHFPEFLFFLQNETPESKNKRITV